ncbi:MAG TPA: ABC transporter ATP-binding protein [Bryobacteraceae bacterium]|nr:ABC transporter ATP-binding protein [Bryobacteraceae bacterium]
MPSPLAKAAEKIPSTVKDKPARSERLKTLLPEVWALVKPRRSLLLLGAALMIINRLCGLALPISSKFLIDNVLRKGQFSLLTTIVLVVVTATVIQGVTSFALAQLLSKAGQRLIYEMRVRIQEHIGRLPVRYYDANKTGAMVSRIMSDVEGVRNLVGTGLVELSGGLLTAVISTVLLFRTSALMTSIVLVILLVFGVVLQRAFKTVRPVFRERGKINAEVTGRLTETLGGVRVIKGYHAEQREAAVFSKGALRLLDNVFKSLTTISLMTLASTVLMGIVGALIMYLGARQVAAHRMDVGDLVMYTSLLAFMVAPVVQIVNIGTQISEALAGLERTRQVLNEKPEDEDPRRTVSLPPIRGHVQFQNVSFAYEEGKPVLHDMSFDAKPGTVTALVGSSGSGKSTMIGLITAFHTPGEGKVLVDGIDLSTVQLASYRLQLGVVLQESFLFDGSIRENVAFSRPQATEEQIMEACRTARVDEFATNFPEGYDTVVGERGVKLSGGQKQRVSIARAILADPRILILDEATSSLDSESEALIQAGLSFLMQGRTTFVIAHRLSTIRRADQILVIEGGRILERGNHHQLFAARGRYYDLYTRQHGLEANLFLAPGEGDKVEETVAS